MSDSSWPHEHLPGACSNSCPLSQWCHPTISSSAAPFSSCPQSFPSSGCFPMSQFSTSGGQNIGSSVSSSALPVAIQGWFHNLPASPDHRNSQVTILEWIANSFSRRSSWLRDWNCVSCCQVDSLPRRHLNIKISHWSSLPFNCMEAYLISWSIAVVCASPTVCSSKLPPSS